MKRDFELVRSILLQVESAPASETLQQLAFEETFDDATVTKHISMMIEAGLIDGEVMSHSPALFVIHRLTWFGHNFLDNARNNTIWKKVMAEAQEKGMSLSMSVLDGLLTKAAQRYVGLD